MAEEDIVVAMTGASGALYGLRLVEVLLQAGKHIHFTLSPAAVEVIAAECGRKVDPDKFNPAKFFGQFWTPILSSRFAYHNYRDFKSGIASGSFLTGGMVICPCSMGTLGAIAAGISDNLITRAANVQLKERRKLILVPRETPLHLIHLRNMTVCTEAGAVILPAMPGFYHKPTTMNELVDFIVARVCDQLGVDHHLQKRWGEKEADQS
ncbi:MAG: UbiX family flavin prenyltransferase [Gemmataceae bacterium]|nr:UbiX family flavin prenyltransferase [Gemmataceae bacterium]